MNIWFILPSISLCLSSTTHSRTLNRGWEFKVFHADRQFGFLLLFYHVFIPSQKIHSQSIFFSRFCLKTHKIKRGGLINKQMNALANTTLMPIRRKRKEKISAMKKWKFCIANSGTIFQITFPSDSISISMHHHRFSTESTIFKRIWCLLVSKYILNVPFNCAICELS